MVTPVKKNTSLHEEYVEKIRKIGERLGFSIVQVKTPLGSLDCVWRLKNENLSELNNLPLAVFEVICSEEQKTIRGSFVNMLVAKSPLVVFVLIEEGVLKHGASLKKTSAKRWLGRMKEFIAKIEKQFNGISRIVIWDNKTVDELYSKYIKNKPA